ncbi:unnamed protein product [Chrysoparadoxa australica]
MVTRELEYQEQLMEKHGRSEPKKTVMEAMVAKTKAIVSRSRTAPISEFAFTDRRGKSANAAN